MTKPNNTKINALLVLGAVILLAVLTNGKQLAGYATGTDEPLPPGCEEGAYVAEGDLATNARSGAGKSVSGECPDYCWCVAIDCPDEIIDAPE